MTNSSQQRGWGRWVCLAAASGALVFGIVLGQLAIATPLAEAQVHRTFTLLYSFEGGTDGEQPHADLIRDAAGNFYGTTEGGGPLKCGTVFKLDTTGTETVLYTFTGKPADGSLPMAGLIRDAAGNLYGTTFYGGTLDFGTVFKLDPTGVETILHGFTGGTDGANPGAGLVRDRAGNLYGTTFYGGESGFGTVYKLDRNGVETVLHSFTGSPMDGQEPTAGLVRDAAGNFYGTTVTGGASDLGTVYKLDASGTESVLYSFTGHPDGKFPWAGLVRDAAGNFYGTTLYGGVSDFGTVYKLDTSGTEAVLHSFNGHPDGRLPYGGLLPDLAGSLYGTTSQGGTFHYGTAFKLDTTGKFTVLHNFTFGATDGITPMGGLIRDTAGNLYGTTLQGGAFSVGAVFKLSR
jgi:uncharacterized repeat protein (TIGR03803 family)